MKLELIQKIDIPFNEDRQYYRLMLLKSGTVVALYSDENEGCYYLDWFTNSDLVQIRIADFTYDVFDPPALFQFSGYVGIYASSGNILLLFTEEEKSKPIKIFISNQLPAIQYPGFKKELSNYVYAGSTDSNTIPFLLKDSGLLPVYFAQLEIDVAAHSAIWTKLNYWNNSQKIVADKNILEKPAKKPFTILHTLNKNNQTYVFGIGDRDGGYLKYGMDYSDLCLLDGDGTVKDTLFSLGRIYKDSKKGGKECLFSSSAEYAMLTPAFNSDDWKGRQKLLDINSRELIEVELPKGLSDFKIIDHHQDIFLLIDGLRNQIITEMTTVICCRLKSSN
ncbi:hypothetical protein ABIE26_002089 [Pedobacter africanus]|uniref:Uncharacterized protein n=1 Tax=Pedobacter africanus TaxID=151894 RepID=A0ACC6KZH5_9SPHI|nr:hypothetical protein [Pedobacter africanus]MDR6784523.1 hypothetical protein [Pedobacter africanus]